MARFLTTHVVGGSFKRSPIQGEGQKSWHSMKYYFLLWKYFPISFLYPFLNQRCSWSKRFHCSIFNFTVPTELSMGIVTNIWKTRSRWQTTTQLRASSTGRANAKPYERALQIEHKRKNRFYLITAFNRSLERQKSGDFNMLVCAHTCTFPQHNYIRSLLKTTHKLQSQMTWHIQKYILYSDGTTFLNASCPSKWWWFSAIRASDFGFRHTWMWRKWRVSSFLSRTLKAYITNLHGAHGKELWTDVVWLLQLC